MGIAIKNRSQLYLSITVNRTPPKNIQPSDEIFFKHEYEKTFPPVYLYELNNVNVSPEGIVFRNFEVFEPCLIDPTRKKNYNWKYIFSNKLQRKKIILPKNEKYILAFDEWSNGYFHWMCDVMPRLIALDNDLNNLKDYYLLLPENYNQPFIYDTLNIFDFKGICKIPSDSFCCVRNLVMPTHIAPTGNYNIEVMHELKNKLIDFYYKNDISLGDKIYISRKKAAYRYILNEEEVIEELNQWGFKVVYFEDYSFQEQVSICKNAKYLIGIIGANLINMMFMPIGGNVLLFNKANNTEDNCYFSLANVFRHSFLYQFCEYKDTKPGAYWNLIVDIKLLRKNLDVMFNN
ncbi:MAG: glycosyltransferase family 61 protein [Bacteroidales bacterium]